jgi:hypothetical protein
MGDKPKWKQLLFPWAEEEQREMKALMESMEHQLSHRESRRSWFAGLMALSGITSALLLIGRTSDYMHRKSEMLTAEHSLKYDQQGKPRPEYWAHRLETEQELEAQQLWEQRLQRDRSKDKSKDKHR